MMYNGIAIIESSVFEPDFFAISDWRSAKETATPEWHQAYFMDDKIFAHPTVVKKLLDSAKWQEKQIKNYFNQ